MKHLKQSGISLIELLVTLAVVSILAMMAAPSVQTIIENNQVHSATSNFLNSLYRARSEAAKRGNFVTLCASTEDQTACDPDPDANGFSDGWIIFTDYDRDQTVDPQDILFDTTGDGTNDSAEQILYASGLPAGNFVIENTGAVDLFQWSITYDSVGIPTPSRTSYRISRDGSNDTQLSRLAIAPTGRVRSCTGDIVKCPEP